MDSDGVAVLVAIAFISAEQRNKTATTHPLERRGIVRFLVGMAEVATGQPADLVLVVADHVEHGAVGFEHPCLAIHQLDTHRRIVEHGAEATLALAQRLFHLLAGLALPLESSSGLLMASRPGLHLVHREVRFAQQLRGGVVGLSERDADADLSGDPAFREDERHGQGVAYGDRDGIRVASVAHARQQDAEFISTEPSDCVARPHHGPQAAGDRAQQLITSRVAE